MFLKHQHSGDLIRIVDLEELFSPLRAEVLGCAQSGEEEQEAECYAKEELQFPSGEPLPRCWIVQHVQALHPRKVLKN